MNKAAILTKILFSSVFMTSFFSTEVAMADCKEAYKYQVRYIRDTPRFLSTTGLAATSAGTPTFGSVATTGLSTTGEDAVINYREKKAINSLRIITEAELGNGIALHEVAKKNKASLDQVARIIRDANNRKVFCQNEEDLYSSDEILTYVAAELKAGK